MIRNTTIAAVVFAFVASNGADADAQMPPLNSDLVVALDGGNEISLESGDPIDLPLKLTFFNKEDAVQKFTNREYVFAIVDHTGKQLEDSFTRETVEREIVLKGRSTNDEPTIKLKRDAFTVGNDYYFICAIRNLAGMVKFTTTTKTSKKTAAKDADLPDAVKKLVQTDGVSSFQGKVVWIRVADDVIIFQLRSKSETRFFHIRNRPDSTLPISLQTKMLYIAVDNDLDVRANFLTSDPSNVLYLDLQNP